MNQGSFAGRIGSDAVMSATPTGKSVLKFSVGVDVWGGPAGKRTMWVNCSMWGDRGAKLAPMLVKGTAVAVSGEVELRQYESKGKPGASLDLRCQGLTLLGRRDQPAAPDAAPAQEKSVPSGIDFNDDIPF
jgi:single-strand DNA-binding protein